MQSMLCAPSYTVMQLLRLQTLYFSLLLIVVCHGTRNWAEMHENNGNQRSWGFNGQFLAERRRKQLSIVSSTEKVQYIEQKRKYYDFRDFIV